MATITSTTTVKHEFSWGAVIETRRTTANGRVATFYEICAGSESVTLADSTVQELIRSLTSFTTPMVGKSSV